MKRFLLAVMLMLAPLAAQDKPQAPQAPPRVQKLFILKYAEPRAVANLLTVFDASARYDNELHTVAVIATPQAMQAIEEAINKLDVPAAAAKNVELTMNLVIGSEGDGSGPLPKDLEPVVAQLRNTFTFKNYRLLDILTLRTRIGQRASTDSTGGVLQFGNFTKPVTSYFSINSSSLGPDGAVRLDGLQASSKIPTEVSPGQFSTENLQLSTDVDIKEGQKVVIGRHGINRDQALFLVLTARVVQ